MARTISTVTLRFRRRMPRSQGEEQLMPSVAHDVRPDMPATLDRLENFRSDVRYAFRQLARSPGVSAAMAVTFALGIGVNATMFTVIDRLLLRPPTGVC